MLNSNGTQGHPATSSTVDYLLEHFGTLLQDTPLWQTIVDSCLKRNAMNRKVRLEKKSEFPRVHSLTDTAVKVAAVK